MRGDLYLATETLTIDAGSELGRQHLHDDMAAEGLVERDEGAAHAAAGQLPIEPLVGTQRILQVVREATHENQAQECRSCRKDNTNRQISKYAVVL